VRRYYCPAVLLVNFSKKEAKTIMQHIVLTAEQARVVLQAGASIDVRDEQGRADKVWWATRRS
jgi:hypothetical protein